MSIAGKYATGNVVINPVSLPNAGDLRQGVNWYGRVGTMVDYSYLANGQVSFNGSTYYGVLGNGVRVYNAGEGDVNLNGTFTGLLSNTIGESTFLAQRSFNPSPFRFVRFTLTIGQLTQGGKCDVQIYVILSYQSNGWRRGHSNGAKNNTQEGGTYVYDIPLATNNGTIVNEQCKMIFGISNMNVGSNYQRVGYKMEKIEFIS